LKHVHQTGVGLKNKVGLKKIRSFQARELTYCVLYVDAVKRDVY